MSSSRMIGEMSMPPRSGNSLRIGRSAGSVMRNRKLPIVPTNWLRELTTLKAYSHEKIAEAISSHQYMSSARTMV